MTYQSPSLQLSLLHSLSWSGQANYKEKKSFSLFIFFNPTHSWNRLPLQSGMAIFVKSALLCITLEGQAQASNVGNLITVFNYKLKLSIARA